MPKKTTPKSNDQSSTPTDTENSKLKSSDVSRPTDLPQPTVVKSGPVKPSHRKMWIWIGAGAGVLLIAAGIGWALMGKSNPPPTIVTPLNQNTNTDGLVARVIDGVLVPPEKVNPNLYAVMIENISESRPPSGLDKASLVYEALAEGGITRFMAIFPVGVDVPELGPVRSARQYYIPYAEELNKPLYVHVGGSPQALSYLTSSQSNVIDFNQFRYAPNFWRDRTRSAPHNLYTSTEKLFLGLKKIAPDLVPAYTPWTFQDEASLADRPEAEPDIVIDYSAFNYRVTYKYHRELNQYFRFQGESEHVTRDNQKVAAKNVVVIFVKTSLIPGDRQRLQMETTGQGRLLVFRDGEHIEGTWKKDGNRDRLQLLDGNGQAIPLNRGTTWVSLVPTDRSVTF